MSSGVASQVALREIRFLTLLGSGMLSNFLREFGQLRRLSILSSRVNMIGKSLLLASNPWMTFFLRVQPHPCAYRLCAINSSFFWSQIDVFSSYHTGDTAVGAPIGRAQVGKDEMSRAPFHLNEDDAEVARQWEAFLQGHERPVVSTICPYHGKAYGNESPMRVDSLLTPLKSPWPKVLP